MRVTFHATDIFHLSVIVNLLLLFGLAPCCFVVCSAGRFVLCLDLVLFYSCVFRSFWRAVALLGEEGANFSAFCSFIRFVLIWFYQFPLPLGVLKGLRIVIVALPGPFFNFSQELVTVNSSL